MAPTNNPNYPGYEGGYAAGSQGYSDSVGYGYGYDEPPSYADPYAAAAYPRTAAPNVPQSPYVAGGVAHPVVGQKSQLAAILLALFGGGLSLHNFYLGYTRRALIQLSLSALGVVTAILLVGIPIILGVEMWVMVELIMLALGSGGYDRDARGIPLK